MTLVDPDATLEDTTGYSTVETVGTLDLGGGTLTLDAGAFLLQGGTLANATVDIAGGSFLSSSHSFESPDGTLDNDVVDGTLAVPGAFKVAGGLAVHPADGIGSGLLTITDALFDEGQAGLDFLGNQILNSVTITLGNFDSAYPAYLEADTATAAKLILTPGVTIDVIGHANMFGWIIDDGTINVAQNASRNLDSATLGGDAAIKLTGIASAVTLSDTFLGTVTGLQAGDTITIAGLTDADVAAVNAKNQLVFYDAEGDVLDIVPLAPAAVGNPYSADSFPITQSFGLGSGTEVTATPVPTGSASADTFEWQQAQAVANYSSDFNTTANWQVDNAEPAAGPAVDSYVDFNNGGIAYTVTGYGVVAGLDVEADTVAFTGGLNVADSLTVQDAATVALQNGAFTLGGIAVLDGSNLLFDDSATVFVGASGIDIGTASLLLLDGSVQLASGPIALGGGTILVGASAGAAAVARRGVGAGTARGELPRHEGRFQLREPSRTDPAVSRISPPACGRRSVARG